MLYALAGDRGKPLASVWVTRLQNIPSAKHLYSNYYISMNRYIIKVSLTDLGGFRMMKCWNEDMALRRDSTRTVRN